MAETGKKSLVEIVPESTSIPLDEKGSEAGKNGFSFETVRLENLETIDELWNEEESFSKNLQNIFEMAIAIPDKEIQLPMILAYAALPSALSSVIPILFLQGQEGSGKSLASVLMAGIHQTEVLSSATTFAAIRNLTQKSRWSSPASQEGEVNYSIVFDNVNASTLKNENMYTFFLNGYNRKTDSVQISKGDGENMIFKVFGPKIISSIFPLYSNPSMAELNRRMLVIKFQRLEKISAKDLGDFDIHERLEIESMDLSVLRNKFWTLWNYQNCSSFMDLKKRLVSRKKGFKIPKTISSTQWALMPDLIASGIISGTWANIESALEGVAAYWDWYEKNIANALSAMSRACSEFACAEVARIQSISQQVNLELPNEIRCESLKGHLDSLAKQGALDAYPTPQAVTLVMQQLGWCREIGSDGHWVWVCSK